MHSARPDSGDQSNRARGRWPGLQLQCRCRRCADGRGSLGAPAGFHERRSRVAARSGRPRFPHATLECERSARPEGAGRGRRGDDPESRQCSRGDSKRRGKSATGRRPGPALRPARNFHRCRRRDGGCSMRMEMTGDMKSMKVDRLSDIRKLFLRNVVPSYSRFDLALDHGDGSYVVDVAGRRYLDLGGGIAVCALGHAHPEITDALLEQSRKLIHVSNLYFTMPQARLAEALVRLIGPGRCFFCNSGAEANEGLYKLARKFGHDTGRFEVLTTNGSFHGRTLAGISATGQEKVKKGFEPMVSGFRQVPFNDLAAMRAAITPQTAAILIESIQGESGITAASPEYLLGLRELCDERRLLLLLDEVQAGHFRTGRFHGWQRVLEGREGA